MSDNRMEIATRARRLIETRGKAVKSTVSGEITGHAITLGGFYMRVRAGLLDPGELYINDMDDRLGATVFSQREVDSTGAFHNFDNEDRLLSVLREVMILDDLANV